MNKKKIENILITKEDIEAIVLLLQKRNMKGETARALENLIHCEHSTVDSSSSLPIELQAYAKPLFLYSTQLQRNPELLQSEYLRDDFYMLNFEVPEGLEWASLRFTELTSKEYRQFEYSRLHIDSEQRVVFDKVSHNVFNPRKKLPWVNKLEDLVGATFRIEIFKGNSQILLKYLQFDYFSYENYATILLEIAHYQKRLNEKSKVVEEAPTNELNNLESHLSNAFTKLKKMPEFKPEFKNFIAKKPTAFRQLLQRLKSQGQPQIPTIKSKSTLKIQGDTIIEYKNCIVRALSLQKFQLLAGRIDHLGAEFEYHVSPNNIINVNLVNPNILQKPKKSRKMPIITQYLRSSKNRFPLSQHFILPSQSMSAFRKF